MKCRLYEQRIKIKMFIVAENCGNRRFGKFDKYYQIMGVFCVRNTVWVILGLVLTLPCWNIKEKYNYEKPYTLPKSLYQSSI